ncbi:MAG: sugar transferase [Weeksellaceae bacterium]|nr:sugar transferase [Weeksellaceae bacterium]
MYKNYIKRLLDFTIALIGIICLSPIFIIVTIGLYFANQGKPFFVQARPGLNEKIFHIIKFKTMNDKTDAQGNLLSDAERLTPIGAFVRKTSLDEIPQLINVLKGDMSIIGPRPLLPQYLNYYNNSEKLRHNVRPGITGLTGVQGRNNLSWFDKMNYDIIYVKQISFLMDIKIFFLTIKKVIIRDGVSKDGHVTTDSFIDYCATNQERIYESK